MSPLHAPSADAERERLHQAAQALEALVLKQLVTASKAFTGGEGPGSEVRAGMFADALADAMVKGGGIGLAKQIEQSLGPRAGPAPSGVPADGARSTPPSPTALIPTPPDIAEPGATLPRVTSPFGMRQDPFDGHLTRHNGVDLAAHEGDLVHATASGVVLRAGDFGGYGKVVELDHGGGVTTLYAHASELLVHEGEHVTQGQSIARVGHSGRATGPHLHLEVRQAGRPVDPSRALKIYGVRADEAPKSGS
jgi:murein DD-endopeptidase MepM/ murein hydrolase activator NlpD